MRFLRGVYKSFRDNQIKKHAYGRYLEKGCRNGFDKEDWCEAEKKWFLKWVRQKFRGNITLRISFFTMLILVIQIFIQSSDFTSLNRPFVEIKPIDMQKDPRGIGEDNSQIWCYLVYEIRNFGPVPAYNVHIAQNGLAVYSKTRGEFHADDIPELREFNIGWLAPKAQESFTRAIIYTDSKTSVDAYKNGKYPLEIKLRIEYDGPKGLLFRRHYWYECNAQYRANGMQILNTNGK